jgi:hypothetical protein
VGAQFGGLFLGRLASMAANGGFEGYSPIIRALYVIDGIGLTLAITALVLDQRASARTQHSGWDSLAVHPSGPAARRRAIAKDLEHDT